MFSDMNSPVPIYASYSIARGLHGRSSTKDVQYTTRRRLKLSMPERDLLSLRMI